MRLEEIQVSLEISKDVSGDIFMCDSPYISREYIRLSCGKLSDILLSLHQRRLTQNLFMRILQEELTRCYISCKGGSITGRNWNLFHSPLSPCNIILLISLIDDLQPNSLNEFTCFYYHQIRRQWEILVENLGCENNNVSLKIITFIE